MIQCPYANCTYEAETEAEVDDHVVYMTSVVNDEDHQ